jgi:hypothetical protein
VLTSLCYLVLRHVLRLAVLGCRSHDLKELEIVVLQHELGILRRQTTRPAMTTVDRLFLAAASRLLPRSRWRSFIITPTTLLRWHRRLVANDGRRHVAPADRQFVQKFGNWSCGSREKTPAGDINASLGSLKDSASRCRRRQCAHGSGKVASDLLALALARPGANSSEHIRKVCSPSISSPWRRSGCNGSTCSSSSSLALVACISRGARPIRTGRG